MLAGFSVKLLLIYLHHGLIKNAKNMSPINLTQEHMQLMLFIYPGRISASMLFPLSALFRKY